MQLNQYETYKRTMESDRAHNCFYHPGKRPARPQRTRYSQGHERNIMDFRNRCTVARSAAKVSTVPNMLQAVPAMGTTGRFPSHCPRACTKPVWARRYWYTRSLCWRYFCAGKKGGPAVGKTKRGKVTKVMAIADTAGFPVAAHVESASLHVDITIHGVQPWAERTYPSGKN